MNLAKAPWVEPMVSRKMIDCLVVKNIGLNGGSWLRKASITGWWFGTWILWLSIYREFHNLNWRTPSFFRGAETTKMIYIHYHSLWLSIWDMVRINLFYFFGSTISFLRVRTCLFRECINKCMKHALNVGFSTKQTWFAKRVPVPTGHFQDEHRMDFSHPRPFVVPCCTKKRGQKRTGSGSC